MFYRPAMLYDDVETDPYIVFCHSFVWGCSLK